MRKVDEQDLSFLELNQRKLNRYLKPSQNNFVINR